MSAKSGDFVEQGYLDDKTYVLGTDLKSTLFVS
jgi:hypothetical protein